MSGFVWLASYPRSGNTWFRLLHASLDVDGDDAPDINDLGASGGSAARRLPFDAITLLDSSLLSIEEADVLRPAVFREIDGGAYRDPASVRSPGTGLMKIHDAYRRTREGQPVFAGAHGAILIVRDPRAVAASLASFLSCSADHAIAMMNSDGFSLGSDARGNAVQMPQSVKSWSSNIESWLVQDEVAVHLLRYEDLKADTAAVFRAAMAFVGRELTPDQADRAAMRTDFATLRRQEAAHGFREWSRLKRTPDSYFFRRGEPHGWREELTAAQIGRIETQHGVMMERLGYPAA